MDCLFCKIVEGTIPSAKVYEDEHVLAFRDIQPQAPVHTLIIPKKHIPTMNDAAPEDMELLGRILLAAQTVARDAGLADDGYRLINNCGRDAGQVVYHLHFHVLGGEKLGPLNVKEQPDR
ncbi:histidine triad nucleotide-binding protein [Cohnella massiliensis]|uniref:histidine triad nucleotide-binding protein n=1 Tax=Cohnella massiliensis TaxID=1816691 RepID=UPI0009BBD658|nr:histidine triad nucleotide-binding protein [Cohnella massiliensis]